MAQALNYLTECGLLDYADLTTRADEATRRYHKLSARIIVVLKTHITALTRWLYLRKSNATNERDG